MVRTSCILFPFSATDRLKRRMEERPLGRRENLACTVPFLPNRVFPFLFPRELSRVELYTCAAHRRALTTARFPPPPLTATRLPPLAAAPASVTHPAVPPTYVTHSRCTSPRLVPPRCVCAVCQLRPAECHTRPGAASWILAGGTDSRSPPEHSPPNGDESPSG